MEPDPIMIICQKIEPDNFRSLVSLQISRIEKNILLRIVSVFIDHDFLDLLLP